MPSITAIVTSCNQARLLPDALGSIKAQERPPDQVVVVDDASGDGSRDLIAGWLSEAAIPGELIANERNLGICRVMNLALARASGDYIAVLHGDDVWLPNKLRAQAAVLDGTAHDVSLVYSDAEVIDEQGAHLQPSALDRYGVSRPRPTGEVAPLLIDRRLSLPAPATLIKRRWLDAVGPYDERLRSEDYNMWVRLSVRSRFEFVDAVVARYRVVPTSLSHALSSVYLQDDLLTMSTVLAEGVVPRAPLLRHQARLATHVYRRGPKARAAIRARIRHEQPARAAALAAVTLGGLLPQGLDLAARLKRHSGLPHMSLD